MKKNDESNNKYFISFVVDALQEHYYRAELLLLSLEHYSKHQKQNILVQCVNRVDNKFISFLEKNGYRYRLIEPFLDGKYCNKLQQLDAFIDETCNGVFLLDTDMFVLEPLLPDHDRNFAAKIVDAPNPPLAVLKKIFSAANVNLPEIVNSDWIKDNNKTIASNFNGGYYYIPYHVIDELSKKWKNWANWLHSKPELFDNAQQRIHVDQVSMAISLADSNIECNTISSNNNYPTHSLDETQSFLPDKPISILHYHNLITPFGLLDKTRVANKKVIKAIDRANNLISQTQNFTFFEDFKKAGIKKVAGSPKSLHITQELKKLTFPIKRRLKLIIHAGTPKSGTTSLQFYMAKHQQDLKANGILYPDHFLKNVYAPKHQWLVENLHQANAANFLQNLKTVLTNVEENTHTIFLSTEGIFNHWWDFPKESKALLAELTSCFDVALWVCLRDPVSFAESYYKQNIKNPRIPNINSYGNDLSFEEMLNDEWFNQHFDYLGFLYECEVVFGKGSAEFFEYSEDVIQTVFNKLGLPKPLIEKEDRENIGLCTAAINLLRVINRYPLSSAEKQHTIPYIKALNETLTIYSNESLIDEKCRNKILEMTSLVNNKKLLRVYKNISNY